jgi:hypothetical protein
MKDGFKLYGKYGNIEQLNDSRIKVSPAGQKSFESPMADLYIWLKKLEITQSDTMSLKEGWFD